MSEPCCGTCRFWQEGQVDPERVGRCRRFPPAINPGAVAEADDTVEAACNAVYCWAFPLTYADDWCGEYAPPDAPA